MHQWNSNNNNTSQTNKTFFLILDGNNEGKILADTSNMPLESKKLENQDANIDECKESFAQITQHTGGYTSYLKSHKMCIF